MCVLEIKHLKEALHEKYEYPKWIISQVVEQVEAKQWTVRHSNNPLMDDFGQPSTKIWKENHLLLLPYQGQKDDFALKRMEKKLKTLLHINFNTQIAFKGKKRNSCFTIKNHS